MEEGIIGKFLFRGKSKILSSFSLLPIMEISKFMVSYMSIILVSNNLAD